MTSKEIGKLALKNGFKLKRQENGDYALNSYVFDFARAIIDASSREVLEEFPLPSIPDQERFELDTYLKQGLL